MKWVQLVPRVLEYRLFRATGVPKLNPMSLTLSVTNQCNSRCKTCNIWKLYKNNAQLRSTELNLKEFEMIFEDLGKSLVWITISGGEPYLRQDLASICKVIYEYCRPKILVIPTNGLLSNLIGHKTKEILDTCPDTNVIVNLSLDGVRSLHDEIRGVRNNFLMAMETYKNLRGLREEYDNLELGIHSVVSRFNVDELPSLYEYVKNKLNPDSYICEFAEHRSELFNKDEDIAPGILSYQEFIGNLRDQIRVDYLPKNGIARIIQAFRLEYYNLALRELTQQRQIIPCYAGFTTCQISAYGDVWPCCILAYDANMGNLREHEYKFKRVWLSQEADRIRKMVKAGFCHCPMANMHYLNMLCDVKTMLKVSYNAVSTFF